MSDKMATHVFSKLEIIRSRTSGSLKRDGKKSVKKELREDETGNEVIHELSQYKIILVYMVMTQKLQY